MSPSISPRMFLQIFVQMCARMFLLRGVRFVPVARMGCLVLLWLCAAPLWAQSRAWFDRDAIALDETVLLTFEVADTSGRGLPDMASIVREFAIVDQNVSTRLAVDNGGMGMHMTVRLTLQPLREGTIELPAMRFGRDTTPPLRLTVLPPRIPTQAPPSPQSSPQSALPAVFIESELETATPYVQQSVGYTVRLYYEFSTLIDGRLDQDPPDGASLQKLSDDIQRTRQIGRTLYNVVERRFLLIPERGGRVVVPAPRFLGRGIDPFSGPFGGVRGDVRVRGQPSELQVRPIPAAAAQPWLPLRGLRLRYLESPQTLRVGETARVTVEVVAEGAVAAQLPSLELRIGDGAQTFPEPAQSQDDFKDDRARTTVVRRFAVLPTRDGTLRIPGPRIDWWDAEAGVARTASLPDLVLTVSPAAAGTPARIEGATADARDGVLAWAPRNLWVWLLLPLGAVWIVVLVWGGRLWWMRRASTRARAVASPAGVPTRPDAQAWARALARGDRGEIARTLCAMAPTPVADLDAVRPQLDDPAQRAAVASLQRARWGRGDAAAAIAAMRTAFAGGPRWRVAAAETAPLPLAPLYPAH